MALGCQRLLDLRPSPDATIGVHKDVGVSILNAPTRDHRRVEWALAAVACLLLAVVRAGRVDERDQFWQIREGLERAQGTPLVRPDTWGWAQAAGLFRPTSPAWNSALAWAFEHGRFAGLFALSFLSIAAALLIALWAAARVGAAPLPSLLALAVMAALGLPGLSPRSSLVAGTLVLLALVVADLLREHAGRRNPLVVGAGAAVLAAVFTTVGSWVHLSWLVLGPLVALAWTAMAVVSPRSGRRTGAAVALGSGVGVVVGLACGPYGFDAIDLTSAIRTASSGLVTEWFSPWTAATAGRWALPSVVAVAVPLGSALALLPARRRRLGEPVPLAVGLAVVTLPIAVAGTTAIRLVVLALLLGIPLLALALDALGARIKAAARLSGAVRHRLSGDYWRPLVALTLLVLAPVAVLAAARLGRPVPEMALTERLPRDCRLFSTPEVSAVALLLRPDVRVWTDLRTEVHGRAHNEQTLERLRTPDAAALPAGTTCVILGTAHDEGSPLADAIRSSPGWQSVASAASLTLWVPRS